MFVLVKHSHTSNRKSASHFALYHENELSHWQVMLGKTELFETTSQLNRLIHKIIRCFESLESALATTSAAQNSENATRTTSVMTTFTNQLQMFHESEINMNYVICVLLLI